MKPVHRLPGLADRGPRGGLRLSVEAGTAGLGPMYHLYPRARGADGALTPPTGDEPPSGLVLVPDVTGGLYDEWEDDLGVPWAHPLEPLTWAADVSSGRSARGR